MKRLSNLYKLSSVKLVLRDGNGFKLNPEIYGNNHGYNYIDTGWQFNSKKDVQDYLDYVHFIKTIDFGFHSRTSPRYSIDQMRELTEQNGGTFQEEGFEEWDGFYIKIKPEQLEELTDIVLQD